MKQLSYLSALTFLFISLISCSPKIVTSIVKNYPPIPDTEEVILFERDNDDYVPATAETVGNIAVVDNGFSVGGKYEKVIDMATNETRKYGGNGLLITDHIKPSIWGSSIHQISGVMLKIDHTTDTALVSSKSAYTSIRENNERNRIINPRHILILNTGYGALARGNKDVPEELKRMNNKLTNGIVWDAQYYYHHKGQSFGLGVMTSQYYSNPFEDAVYNSSKNSVRLNYIAPSLALRQSLSTKWMWNFIFGLGYLGMTQKATDINNSSNYGTRTGSTLGAHLATGFDYKLSKQFGIGADFSYISGFFTSVKDKNFIPNPSAPEINNDNRLNGSRLSFNIGIRYYIY